MASTFENDIERINKYIKTALKQPRYEHCIRVAQMTATLCRLHGEDEEKGYLAGIAHDMCREMSDESLKKITAFDGLNYSELEQKKPSVLHGRAAACVLKKDFGIIDENVIQAVQNHTSGKANLCVLGQLLFVADKIEPDRPQSTPEYRKRLFSLSRIELVISVIEENIEYLKNKGKILSYESQCFLESLKQERSESIE